MDFGLTGIRGLRLVTIQCVCPLKKRGGGYITRKMESTVKKRVISLKPYDIMPCLLCCIVGLSGGKLRFQHGQNNDNARGMFKKAPF